MNGPSYVGQGCRDATCSVRPAWSPPDGDLMALCRIHTDGKDSTRLPKLSNLFALIDRHWSCFPLALACSVANSG